MYTLSEIAQISGGEIIGKTNPAVNNFVTDSRQLLNTNDSVFFAIKSNRNDGHFYIDTLVRLGLKAFVITDKTKIKETYLKDGASFVVVSNALTSLQMVAAHHRLKFKFPIIGITGSNGKTIVKEWLYQLLSDDYTICRSPKSYNSQIGVPLSVLNINQNHNLGIFEAGISLPNEMNKLQEIVKPTLGVFTSFGEAHSQGFESNKHKLTEKLKLFEDCNKVIFNAFEHEDLLEYLSAKFVSIGSNKNCNYNLSFQIKSNFTEIVLSALGKSYSYKIHFIDKASVLNASTCIVTLMEMGLDQSLIQQKLSKLQSIALRLEVKNATQNSILINDFYNSDIDSIKIALGFLNQQHRRKNKVLIISDLDETGKPEQELYTELSKLIEESKIDFLVCIGEALNRNGKLFKTKSVFFNGVKDFLAEQSVLKVNFKDATILLKGAHRFKFEDISKLLQLKSHDTVLEINLNKLQHNVNYYRTLIGKEVQLMCMVKAMGYGSGGSEIARSLQHMGVNYLAVAYADEGVELRDSNISLPIMVMSPERDSLEDIINYKLEPEIYSFRVLKEFTDTLNKLGIDYPYPIHLKLDTGMKRLGFEKEDISELIESIKSLKQIKVASVFSHLAGSDNKNLDPFTESQINLFTQLCNEIEKGIGYSFIKHICNTGGISRFKKAHFNMVRLGIGMYGFGIDENENKLLEYTGVLKTCISQIKLVKKEETVGYNRMGQATHDMKIATIPIGYADGFHRSLGNANAGVYINGKFCKTVGNICMDMCMVDITAVECKEGDEVIVFENTEQVNAIAKAMNSIAYEVLTNISGRVKRVYIQE